MSKKTKRNYNETWVRAGSWVRTYYENNTHCYAMLYSVNQGAAYNKDNLCTQTDRHTQIEQSSAQYTVCWYGTVRYGTGTGTASTGTYMVAVGAASPRAHGQLITKQAIANLRLNVATSSD
jgi:hypothetical protein